MKRTARFGRTVTDQVFDAVSGRLAAPKSAGVAVSLAGRAVPVWSRQGVADEYGSSEDAPGGIPGAQSLAVQSWSPTARDLRSDSSFALTGEPDADGGMLSFWGQGTLNRFDGREDGLVLDGLAANDESPVGRRLNVELGYGLAVFGGDFTGAPNAGVALTESGRDWRLGWRLTPAWPDASGFEVNLDVVRNEVDGEAPEHAVMLRGGVRF